MAAGYWAQVRPERDVVLGDRYVLSDRIAVGAMGEVWAAKDTVLGRPVAVKILKPELRTASTFLARFRAEARHAGGLSHPGIATVYDYGETGDLAFLVMELVRGRPLSEMMAEPGALGAADKLSILAQTAEALVPAHAAGVVHRDIKPGNLMVRPDGTVKVTDFGIARALASASLTDTGQMLGTPTYLSPEQAVGGQVTGASDIYSLGVVAYELFAGHPPFERDTPLALALAHVNDPPPPLPEAVPAGVADLIIAALEKEPSRRPASATAFAALLRRELAAMQPATTSARHDRPTSIAAISWPSPTGPAVTPARAARPPVAARRRRRRPSYVPVVAFVGLLLLSGVTLWAATRSGSPDEATFEAPVTSTVPDPLVASESPVPGAAATTVPSGAVPTATTIPSPSDPVSSEPAAPPPPATRPPATQSPATQPPATQPPATEPPATQPPTTEAPTTVAPPAGRTAPLVPAAPGAEVTEGEAVAFIVDYYDRIAAGDYDNTWESLSQEFRDARNLTFERYVGYWKTNALEVGEVTFVPGPGPDQGRVRFAARYITPTRVVDQTDEITLRRLSDGRLIITQQRRM